MLFVKTNLNDQVEVRIDLYEDEIFTICPSCGKEHQLDIETVRQIDCWSSTSISCGSDECNRWMKEECEKRNSPQTAAEAMNKKTLDDLFEFCILKFIQKDGQKFYHVFGYSDLGDEVEFGIRPTLKEAQQLLGFYSQKEPDYQVIKSK